MLTRLYIGHDEGDFLFSLAPLLLLALLELEFTAFRRFIFRIKNKKETHKAHTEGRTRHYDLMGNCESIRREFREHFYHDLRVTLRDTERNILGVFVDDTRALFLLEKEHLLLENKSTRDPSDVGDLLRSSLFHVTRS